MSSGTTDPVMTALGRVYDPCSVACDSPLSIVEMGLVVDVRRDPDGRVTVVLCVTGPCCTMAPHLLRAAEAELARIPGVTSVRVELDPTVLWTTDRMKPPARAKRRRQGPSPVQPRQWQRVRSPREASSPA